MQRTGLFQTSQEWKIREALMGKYFNNKSLEPACPNLPRLASCSLVLLGFSNPFHRQPFCKHLVIQQRRLKFIPWALSYPRCLVRHHQDFQLSGGLNHIFQQKQILKREGSPVVAAVFWEVQVRSGFESLEWCKYTKLTALYCIQATVQDQGRWTWRLGLVVESEYIE